MAKANYCKTFLTWLVFFNWPPVLMWIPYVWVLVFFPALFWINIPALWLGLAKAMGPQHFSVGEFGSSPKTVFAWLGIFIFWALAAAAMTGLTELVRGRFKRDELLEVTPDRDEESLDRLRESFRQ